MLYISTFLTINGKKDWSVPGLLDCTLCWQIRLTAAMTPGSAHGKRPTRQSSSSSAYDRVRIRSTSLTVSWPPKSHSVSFLQLAVTSCSLRNTLTLFLTFNCQNKYHYPSAELAYSHSNGEQRRQHLSWSWRQTVEVLMLKSQTCSKTLIEKQSPF